MSSRLKAVIACKGFNKILKMNILFMLFYYIYLSNYIWAPENGGGGCI